MQNQIPLSHIPKTSEELNFSSPLADLIGALRKEEDFHRLHRLVGWFEHFHLKYTVTSAVEGRKITLNGREVINFGSANYLGLEQDPEVMEASKKAIDEWGLHAGCSRVFSSHESIVLLEKEISELVGSEATLIGHNVSQIHAGVIPTLFSSENSVLFIDRYAHTSMYQASLIAKAKGARIVRVDVSDVTALEQVLRSLTFERGALLVDGVYSMQGHLPDLKKLDSICRDRGLLLYIDDAHGVGVYGARGGGAVEELGLKFDNILLIGSLQKAFGTYGGFISGHKTVIDFLRVTSKAYIFSGTLQPAAVEGARTAIRLARSAEGQRRRQLVKSYSRQVRRSLLEMGFETPEGDSPIVPVLIGDDLSTLMAGRKMFDLGIYLNSVLYPAVPHNAGVLRISLTSMHTPEQIDSLIKSFLELKEFIESLKNPARRWAYFLLHMGKSKIQGEHYEGL